MAGPRKLAAGNWKMNGVLASLAEIDQLLAAFPEPRSEVLICPPATLIHPMTGRIAGGAIQVGSQNCHMAENGAHTGELSAGQLRDVGASYVILGHSERRADQGESDQIVHDKAVAAYQAGLVAIICVGETESQRDAETTLDVIAAQMAGSIPDRATAQNTVIAYEPVWAIGTGRTPSEAQIAQVHAFMRQNLATRFPDALAMRLLYGGSVKSSNAGAIFDIPNVDGALVGGASLKAADFGPIIAALDAA